MYNVDPKSRGCVKIKSADPDDDPVIDINVFDDPRDLETLKDGIKFTWKLNNTKAFKKIGAVVQPVLLKQCSQFDPFSDEGLECQIKYCNRVELLA